MRSDQGGPKNKDMLKETNIGNVKT